MLRTERNGYGERAPLAGFASGPHLAAVQPGQFPHQRQADARTLLRPAAGALDPVKPLEQPRHPVGGDAGPGVADRQLRGPARRPQ